VTPGPITTNYGYEYENRLTSVSNPSYTAAYTYSADGLRLRAQESNHQYADRWFLYAGALPFCEGTLSGDTHSLCAQGRLYTSNKIYIREGLSYYDPLVFSSVGGYRRHYLYDGLGSTRQLLNDSQTVTDTYSYEAFGNLTASTGTTANPYKYVGSLGYYSPTAAGGSSLQHLGARYYLPELGRFIQQDPLGMGHPYAYCDSNPVAWVDPEGLGVRDWLLQFEDSTGLGSSIDRYAMLGRTANYGHVTGLHDAGCASGLAVVWAGAQWGGMMASTAFTVTEAPGARLALRPKVLGAEVRVYGRFWGFADLRHSAHHAFSFLGREFTVPHAQIAARILGKTRMLRIPWRLW